MSDSDLFADLFADGPEPPPEAEPRRELIGTKPPKRWSGEEAEARREDVGRELREAVREANAFMPEDGAEKLRTLVDHLEAGVPEKHALKAAGITERRFRLYMQHGALADAGKPVRLFYEAVIRAVPARIRGALQAVITAISEGDWKAAAWLLARLDPEAFGEHQTIRIQLQNRVRELMQKVVEILVEEVTDRDALARIDTRFRAELGEFVV